MNQKRRLGLTALVALMLAVLVTGCATQTSYDNASHIIEPTLVGDMMNESNVVVIDAREPDQYDKGHLEGAVGLAPARLTRSEPVGGLVASKDTFESIMSEIGVANDSSVFIYDDKGGVYSARLWWVMKLYGHEDVRVINQGARGLERAGLPMSAEVPSITKTSYEAKEADALVLADIEEVKAIANGTSTAKLIDVRSRAEFDEGAIPNAVQYAHTENLYNDGAFKSKTTIELNYKDLGLEKDDEIILYCKSSFRAAQTAALLMEAGYEKVKVYDGAWLEWQNQGMPKKETAPKLVPTEQDAS